MQKRLNHGGGGAFQIRVTLLAVFAGFLAGPGRAAKGSHAQVALWELSYEDAGACARSHVATAATLKGKREAWSRGPEGDLEACQRDAIAGSLFQRRVFTPGVSRRNFPRSGKWWFSVAPSVAVRPDRMKSSRESSVYNKRPLTSKWHVDRHPAKLN